MKRKLIDLAILAIAFAVAWFSREEFFNASGNAGGWEIISTAALVACIYAVFDLLGILKDME